MAEKVDLIPQVEGLLAKIDDAASEPEVGMNDWFQLSDRVSCLGDRLLTADSSPAAEALAERLLLLEDALAVLHHLRGSRVLLDEVPQEYHDLLTQARGWLYRCHRWAADATKTWKGDPDV